MLRGLNATLASDVLARIGLKDAELQASVMSCIQKDQVDVIFLQGSSSFLMKHLELEGKRVTKRELLDVIDKKLLGNCVGGGTPHNLTDAANLLMGRMLFNSTATPAIAFISQRECEGPEDTIHTQLYYGFAAVSTASTPRQGPLPCVACLRPHLR